LRVLPEIQNFSGKIEKFRGKFKFLAEDLQLRRRIQIFSQRVNVSGEDSDFHAKI